ncbi:MAG: methyltransferase domain-containing protein, partial [Chloroflexi bacterium]|nr:methyltransferase domain-containing protein [Chloroflexota bacterium]
MVNTAQQPGYGPALQDMFQLRRASSRAAYLLPHLRAGFSLLDCGCGPGTVTIGLAEAVAPGQVVGIDLDARSLA